jgi:hypothetical protein
VRITYGDHPEGTIYQIFYDKGDNRNQAQVSSFSMWATMGDIKSFHNNTISENEFRARVQHYDFSHARHIVDVGGAHGDLLLAMLDANPHAHGTVFDRPHVADAAREAIHAKGRAGRCGASAERTDKVFPPLLSERRSGPTNARPRRAHWQGHQKSESMRGRSAPRLGLSDRAGRGRGKRRLRAGPLRARW